ncbi:class III extradiol dioxygenase subunit B-like domain-containing protein [Kitasatospora purpeofusca]|uniref:class III extradiol dioxygenase subunit B-like domain-containing protein n=1 Tax=Kitasatospora purpeofusca TaxID=67352 RepID=UPI00225BF4DD|nr:class III extradiol dioxygenase subunit B-like domain-containing protein [Kitasatospora purpeofusca]MCX4757730.1 class III extradiol dioxygenase subunit B-like domain-containing protein [Kitasatospora purpeofusca]WSR34568.1 class III extradiol dioxygenase subunit B-like domain-containing protein [Kitasatospora purpeofusca]
MLVAAAVCPCPPLLVPEVAAGASAELEPLRAACDEALGAVLAAEPELLVVVGTGPEAEVWTEGGAGSFHRYGVPLVAALPGGRAEGPELSPALTVGAWLLGRSGTALPTHACAVPADAPADRMLGLGQGLAGLADRVGLLVMGDGSACRSLKAPGYLDERAEGYDAVLARALGTADTAALAALDPGLAAELKAEGRAPWQVLAGAAEGAGLTARLGYQDAPYGVGYLVASWS